MITVNARTVNGETYSVNIEPSDTIKNFKNMLIDSHIKRRVKLIMIYMGKVLKDKTTLVDNNIKNGSTVNLIISEIKEAPPPTPPTSMASDPSIPTPTTTDPSTPIEIPVRRSNDANINNDHPESHSNDHPESHNNDQPESQNNANNSPDPWDFDNMNIVIHTFNHIDLLNLNVLLSLDYDPEFIMMLYHACGRNLEQALIILTNM
ncbi:MAG: ubiquitin-like domain-containing protein [candidate division WOR-3 bacterium]